MDDGLTSVATVEQAVSLIERSRALCAKAGLRLHKFVANKVIMADIQSMFLINNQSIIKVEVLAVFQSLKVQNLLRLLIFMCTLSH